MIPPEAMERFWAKVRYSPGCWEWTAVKWSNGYGQFWLVGRLHGAHRLSLSWSLGRELRSDEFALHSCHNRACVNPLHLRVGTHQDNMDDRSAAGRQPKGTRHGCAKLTREQVFEIRRLAADGQYSQREIGVRFGIHFGTVSDIHRRKSWKHLDTEETEV